MNDDLIVFALIAGPPLIGLGALIGAVVLGRRLSRMQGATRGWAITGMTLLALIAFGIGTCYAVMALAA